MNGRRWGLLALTAIASVGLPARADGAGRPGGLGRRRRGASRAGAGGSAPFAAAAARPARRHRARARLAVGACRDGLDQVRALHGDPSAPWADTVARLCGNVLRTAPATAAPGETISERASANEGRGRLVFWSSLYGIWLGIAGDVLTDVNSVQSAVILPMVGMGVALGTSLVITAHHPASPS